MKHFNALACIVFLISCNSVVYSQKFTVGINSGINLSDIHGQKPEGKWSFKPGPAEEVFLRYSFTRFLGIQTGIDFSSITYEHTLAIENVIYYDELDWIPAPSYSHSTELMNFSFLRVPLLINLTIPNKLQFDMRAGIYYSFMQDYSLTGNNYYARPGQDKPKKNDFGYIFSSGISYPLIDNFKATLNVSYVTGRKPFLEHYNYRHGSSEFTLGLAYGFLNRKSERVRSSSGSDSLSNRVTITYKAGVNFAWNSCSRDGKNYSVYPGPALGFSLNIPFKNGTSLQTGFMFDKLGYSLKDSSSLFYCFTRTDKMYYCDTRVQIDYATIPVLLNIPVGRKDMFFINTGPWFGLRLNARNVGVAYNVAHSSISTTLNKYVVYSDMDKIITDYDYGWIAGCGISLPVGDYKVELGLQYRLGFLDVFNRSEVYNLINTSDRGAMIHNRALTFLIGIKMPSFYN